MGLKRRGNSSDSEKPNVEFTNLEEGREYEARLVYVADLGLHENSYMGEAKPDVQKIALGYEILGETIKIDDVETPRLMWEEPINIYWSMSENGKELQRYRIFVPSAKPDEVANWDAVLGIPVNITIKHVRDKKDKDIIYDNIESVQAIPKKYHKDVPKSTLTPCVGDADDPDNEATKALYGLTKWMFDRRIVEKEHPDYGEPNEKFVATTDDDVPF
jgi:hypothetical protein